MKTICEKADFFLNILMDDGRVGKISKDQNINI